MKTATHTKRRLPIAEINVVPYIDVTLVLLIIFMITAPLLTEGVKVELPQAPAEAIDQDSREPLVVTVDQEGAFYIEFGDEPETPVDERTLLTRVSALLKYQPGLPVLVRGDKNVPYGQVVYVMALLQRAGAPSVGLITEDPEVAG